MAQIYVDGIVFRVTLTLNFVVDMKKEFEMNMVGELNFFQGLQIRQLKDDIFLS